MRPPSFTEVVTHPKLLGPYFAGPSWDRWKAIGKALFAEPMSPAEVELLREVAQRSPPSSPVGEAVLAIGRGGGKDAFASAVAVKVATGDYRKRLRPGEKAVVMVIAVSRDQASVAFNYIRAAFEESAPLKAMVVGVGADYVELNNGVVVEVHTNSYRSTRGRSLICVILDECAFFRDEGSANPDVELVAALRPGLARMPGSKLILISTVHRRAGLLYGRIRDCFGKDDPDALAVVGTTLQFNPGFDAKVIAADLARDPALFGAEYNSEWRDDLSNYISRELIDAAIDRGVIVRPPQAKTRYVAACDAGGGTGDDSFTASFCHREGSGRDFAIVQDLLYERRPPFDPADVVAEITELMAEYGIREITGDRYAAGFTISAFEKRGRRYRQSERDRSQVYVDALPLFSSGRIRLLDNARQSAQFAALERRTFPTGKDRVNHPGGKHDDCANSAAMAATLAAAERGPIRVPDAALAAASSPARRGRRGALVSIAARPRRRAEPGLSRRECDRANRVNGEYFEEPRPRGPGYVPGPPSKVFF